MDREEKSIEAYKINEAMNALTPERFMIWAQKWKIFYGKIPYGVDHYWRNLEADGLLENIVPKDRLKKFLENLCQDKKMVRVGEEYMLHPEVARNGIYVNAFIKNVKK